jgi:hypothetical protein
VNTEFSLENQKRRNHSEETGVHGRTVLKLILIEYDGMV